MQAAAGRLRVSGAKSALRASDCGRLRVGSWRLRLPHSFHARRHSGSMCRTLSAAVRAERHSCCVGGRVLAGDLLGGVQVDWRQVADLRCESLDLDPLEGALGRPVDDVALGVEARAVAGAIPR